MKRHYVWTSVIVLAVSTMVAWVKRDYLVPTTILSLRIGETYDDVVKGSTFAVEKNSTPFDQSSGYRATYVDSAAVVIEFNDPVNGFGLPPTKFAGIGYGGGRVETITTSPMLEALPFDEAIGLVNQLQADFKRGGWEPIERSGERPPTWFDTVSATGLAELRRGSTRELVVPHKYAMYFNFKCWDDCIPAPNEKSRYLIDVSMGPER